MFSAATLSSDAELVVQAPCSSSPPWSRGPSGLGRAERLAWVGRVALEPDQAAIRPTRVQHSLRAGGPSRDP